MKDLMNAVIQMDEQSAIKQTEKLLADGKSAMEILDTYREALSQIGTLFERGECFLPELILSGEMLKTASEKLKPFIQKSVDAEKRGRVVVGTVQGDVHDIGKDIVVLLLDASGYEVMDVGVDVSAETFTTAVQEFMPQVLGLSGLLSSAYGQMKGTIELLNRKNLRSDLKIMIGGGQMSDSIRIYTGADAFGNNAVAAVRLCDDWIEEGQII